MTDAEKLRQEVAQAICCRTGCMNRGCPYCLADEETAERVIRIVLERAETIAWNGWLVPPDGGSPMADEVAMCDRIATAIRALGCEHSP